MQELIKTLDENLKYIDSELVGDTMQIRVESNREEAICPHCGQGSSRVHIRHQRVFQDMPVMGHKSQIFLESRKMFCDNPDCKHTTFAERFDFLKPKARRTNRLTDHVLESAVGASSVLTAKTLRKGTCEIGKSTICNLLKKKKNRHRQIIRNACLY